MLESLFGNLWFWIFGVIVGGSLLAKMVRTVADHRLAMARLEAEERARLRQQELETERRLLGVDDDQNTLGLKLRIEALEKDVTQLRQWVEMVYRALTDGRERSEHEMPQMPRRVTVQANEAAHEAAEHQVTS
ncbi:MAG TPA: hypothetical protein PLQ54_06440 [Armatimonadota bacterium]|nr:hypothetical protein [Armatimonadota bacterium]